MNQQTIDKLMEIKKLYEAGVLTKEEMEAEKAKILHPTSVASESKTESKTVASNDKPQPRTSKGTLKQGLSKDTKIWLIAGSVVAVMLIIAIIIQNGRSSNSQTYDNDYAVADTDTAMVDDTDYDTAVDDSQEQTPQSYADKAENYIGGLDTDTRVVASLTDDDRHCVYTLTEVEAGWGRVNSLYCHNLETGSTNLVLVPYKVEGEEDNGEQVADAKIIGNNLYVINTSYRCGSSVACLNTLTNNWSCAVRACADAKFVGSNKLKVTYSKLVYEGECLADNQYEYKDKVITLK
ncbi:SHOCT domain-containing protein [uncultured Prevotella sp.]|uniref:SHOCT domain-containing protein n=1 Tax=uncultured Prevotella sp. TaxID=159272 RepID=UPI0027E32584|nr:SHOCT domain-containing protein [uncultured Prevotella sp.]